MEFLKTFTPVETIDCSGARIFGQTEPRVIEFDDTTELVIPKQDFQNKFSSSLNDSCPITKYALAMEVDTATSSSLLNETIKMSDSSFEISFNFAELYAQDFTEMQFYIVAMPNQQNRGTIPVILSSLKPIVNTTDPIETPVETKPVP